MIGIEGPPERLTPEASTCNRPMPQRVANDACLALLQRPTGSGTVSYHTSPPCSRRWVKETQPTNRAFDIFVEYTERELPLWEFRK